MPRSTRSWNRRSIPCAGGDGAEGQRALIPLGHYGDVVDVANTVAFLAGPGGRHVNGASITVDGGANA
ncbi:MAG: SDR family oxidoreductase [Actinophytocola sp.]|uniref:SDR family oxidoreductase n=1 Tax=Actinophytocola sp. TaxID=1872138 RepID=UPI003C72D3A8